MDAICKPLNHYIVGSGQKQWLGVWLSYPRPDGSWSSDRFLMFRRFHPALPLDEQLTVWETADMEEAPATIRKAVVQARIAEIRAELGITPGAKPDLEAALSVVRRAHAGEFMGQYHDSYGFYAQNLGEVFGLDARDGIALAEELLIRGKIGLNGLIIVPVEEMEEAYRRWEASTGHKRLEVSDSGNWICLSCGKGADSAEGEPWAGEVPCRPLKVEEESCCP